MIPCAVFVDGESGFTIGIECYSDRTGGDTFDSPYQVDIEFMMLEYFDSFITAAIIAYCANQGDVRP